MPKPGFTNEENQKYDELLAKLRGENGQKPTADEVVQILMSNPNELRDFFDRDSHTPISDAKNDYFKELLASDREEVTYEESKVEGQPPKEIVSKQLSEEKYNYAVEINRKLNKAYIEKKVQAYGLIQEAKKGVKEHKFPGTEWLVFPADDSKVSKIAENIVYMTDPKPFDELKEIQLTRVAFQQFSNDVYYKGRRLAKDMDTGKVSEVEKKATVYDCFFEDYGVHADEYYASFGVTDTMVSSEIEDEFMNFEVGSIDGFEFNKDYKPGDTFIVKYPKDFEELKGMKSKEEMQEYFTKLNNQYIAAEDYEKSCLEVKKQAQELLDKLESYEYDGDHSLQYYKMQDELQNITKMGEDMVLIPKSVGMMEVKGKAIDKEGVKNALERVNQTAKDYEDTHGKNAFSPNKYHRGMLEMSKQLQTFATLAKEKLDVKNFPGMGRSSTEKTKKDVEKQLSRGKAYAERMFGDSKFRLRARTNTVVETKLDRMLERTNEATRNVHLGSNQYKTAANSLKDAVSDYKKFTKAYLDPASVGTGGKKLSREELVVSLNKAKEDINKYIEYKRKNGYIAEGKVAAPKTQKRIDAMRESLKTVELALNSLGEVMKEMDGQRADNQRKLYSRIEKEPAKAPAPKQAPVKADAKARGLGNDENIIDLNESNISLGLDDENEFEINTSSKKKEPAKAEENKQLPADVSKAMETIKNGRDELDSIVNDTDRGRFENELQNQINSRKKVLEYTLSKGEPSADMKAQATEDVEELAAGMITAKTFLTRSKKDPTTIDKLHEEGDIRIEQDRLRFDFKEEVSKLKDSTQFQNFAASNGKDPWENAKKMRDMALKNNGDQLYGGYANQSAKTLTQSAVTNISTKLKMKNATADKGKLL